MKRRSFLMQSAMAGIAAAGKGVLPAYAKTAPGGRSKQKTILRFGVCADLHQDLIQDGERRLQAFISEMNQMRPDFIIQMGDLCVPKESNKPLIGVWNQFSGPRYHVIGNHDRDGGFTFDEVIAFWGAKGPYYSFDAKGYHFIVLNGNERNANETYKGYPRSVTKEQRKWLERDVEATNFPVIVFCHQGIDNDMDGLWEGNLLRVVFERLNEKAGRNKIQAVFSGHHHENYCNVYNGIHYVQINSISYQFSHSDPGYDFVHCEDPIWAVVTILESGAIEIRGRKSSYEDGSTEWNNATSYDGYPTVSYISDRVLRI